MQSLMIDIFIKMRFLDIIDILLVAILLYALYNLTKGTVAIRIFIGIVSFYLIWKLVEAFQMELLSEILGSFISVGVIALIIVFQQEIRKFLLLLGTPNFLSKRKGKFLFFKFNFESQDKLDTKSIFSAILKMSKDKTGALIVIPHTSTLQEYIETGVKLNAEISSALIESIFYKNNPLHDGAIIISENKIIAARVILPITQKIDFPPDYGLRHRAAVGITEQSDAVALIVSEQTGGIAISKKGNLKTGVSYDNLNKFLKEELFQSS